MSAAAGSLRRRLLAATVVVLVLALVAAGLLIGGLFREHVTQQYREGLRLQLDQLAGATAFDADGKPQVDAARLTDPRWQRPYSGWYWQVDGAAQPGLLRSRSLWDSTLALPVDPLADGAVHAHDGNGPRGQPLIILERSVHDPGRPGDRWRLVVAGNTEGLESAVARFRGQLALSLLLLFALLAAASWAQVAVGLAPLRALRAALDALRGGRAARLDGRFPREVQPLVDDFNAVLEQNAAVVERARKHAGNLAHALKTPIAVLQHAADQLADGKAEPATVAQAIAQQLDVARRQVDWHLARSRAAAQLRSGAEATPVLPVLQGLVRVLERVHADRGLRIALEVPATVSSACEEQDLQEMLGNVLDNACKWARSAILVTAGARHEDGRSLLCIRVEDDGPGLDALQLAQLPVRGKRLDETIPGAGLGLAIVQDLVEVYGGRLTLERAALGGLAVQLCLPGSPATVVPAA